jgi:hypothetical protein
MEEARVLVDMFPEGLEGWRKEKEGLRRNE